MSEISSRAAAGSSLSLDEQRVATSGELGGRIESVLQGRPYVLIYSEGPPDFGMMCLSNMERGDLRTLLRNAVAQHSAAELLATAQHESPEAKA